MVGMVNIVNKEDEEQNRKSKRQSRRFSSASVDPPDFEEELLIKARRNSLSNSSSVYFIDYNPISSLKDRISPLSSTTSWQHMSYHDCNADIIPCETLTLSPSSSMLQI